MLRPRGAMRDRVHCHDRKWYVTVAYENERDDRVARARLTRDSTRSLLPALQVARVRCSGAWVCAAVLATTLATGFGSCSREFSQQQRVQASKLRSTTYTRPAARTQSEVASGVPTVCS
jgi:hypothetical protein